MEYRIKHRLSKLTQPDPAMARIRGVRSINGLRDHGDCYLCQEIEDARTAYLETRARVLKDFNDQRTYIRARTEDLLNPLLSANGDIKNDFAVLGRVDNDEDAITFRQILLDVYGVATLVSQPDNIIVPAPVKEKVNPSAKIARSARLLKQSFSQLQAEYSRTAKQARQPIPQFPLNITDSDDMLVILNARATVLLNVSFRNISQSKHVVKLSFLAQYLFSTRRTESELFDREISDEGKAWMIQRLLQLIRDDIYQLLIYAGLGFVEAEREEQQRHIDVFCTGSRTWQNMVNRQIKSAWGHDHEFEFRDDFPGCMAALRAKCEI